MSNSIYCTSELWPDAFIYLSEKVGSHEKEKIYSKTQNKDFFGTAFSELFWYYHAQTGG